MLTITGATVLGAVDWTQDPTGIDGWDITPGTLFSASWAEMIDGVPVLTDALFRIDGVKFTPDDNTLWLVSTNMADGRQALVHPMAVTKFWKS